MLTDFQRLQFDELLESIIDGLPQNIRHRLEELPVVVEDQPSEGELAALGLDRDRSILCGLHWGVPLTRRSAQHSGALPDRIMLFREPILAVARMHHGRNLYDFERQIRITLLHEIGHHFGLSENDLAKLGYG